MISHSDAMAEKRRQKVLGMLTETPRIMRAMTNDLDSDPSNVIITIAVRGMGTCEALIPKQDYDDFKLMDIMDKLANKDNEQ